MSRGNGRFQGVARHSIGGHVPGTDGDLPGTGGLQAPGMGRAVSCESPGDWYIYMH